MSFSSDMVKFSKALDVTLDKAMRAVKIKLFNSIIQDTRVDTGRLRGNWQTSTGSPILNEIDRKDKIEKGTAGGDAQEEVIDTVQGLTTDYMTNNLPYAGVYEEKDGMVSKNMARINRNIKEAIKEGV